MPIQLKAFQIRNPNLNSYPNPNLNSHSNPSPKVDHLTSVNQSHGSKDLKYFFCDWLKMINFWAASLQIWTSHLNFPLKIQEAIG